MYKNYLFDLYGTLVDINTNEWKTYLWSKMAELYAFEGADYTPMQLKKSIRCSGGKGKAGCCKKSPEFYGY